MKLAHLLCRLSLTSMDHRKWLKLNASKGGLARKAALTPERRSEIAKKAVAAREARRAEGGKKKQGKKLQTQTNTTMKNIIIEVNGGVVVDVRHLPEGYGYELIDHDNEPERKIGDTYSEDGRTYKIVKHICPCGNEHEAEDIVDEGNEQV